MNSMTVVAYTCDGDLYCTGCAEDLARELGGPVDALQDLSPVFAGDEFSYASVCRACGELLDLNVLCEEDDDA